MAKKQKSDGESGNLPEIDDLTDAGPVKVTLAEDFLRAGEQALTQTQRLLDLNIDLERITNPEWLSNAENRRVALVLMKALGLQMNAALGIISGSIKVGTKIHEAAEQERRREAALEELARRLQEPQG